MTTNLVLVESDGLDKRRLMANLYQELIQLVQEKKLAYEIKLISYSKFKEQKIEDDYILLEPSLQVYEREKIRQDQVMILDSYAYIIQDSTFIIEQLEHYREKVAHDQMKKQFFKATNKYTY